MSLSSGRLEVYHSPERDPDADDVVDGGAEAGRCGGGEIGDRLTPR